MYYIAYENGFFCSTKLSGITKNIRKATGYTTFEAADRAARNSGYAFWCVLKA